MTSRIVAAAERTAFERSFVRADLSLGQLGDQASRKFIRNADKCWLATGKLADTRQSCISRPRDTSLKRYRSFHIISVGGRVPSSSPSEDGSTRGSIKSKTKYRDRRAVFLFMPYWPNIATPTKTKISKAQDVIDRRPTRRRRFNRSKASLGAQTPHRSSSHTYMSRFLQCLL
jgi:hypothetical protein